MKRFTYKDIKSWNPCYDPIKHIPETWEGTSVDMLKLDHIPFEDRLWCVLRSDLVSDKIMRLFAVWSYRQTLSFVKNADPRSIECARIAELFALCEATEQQLNTAESAARSAAWYAAESAAWSAWSAESAARSAAWYAAWSAAWSAAESAARSAAWSAAWSAESAARSAAESAARSAAWSAQQQKLIDLILTEEKQNVAS